MKQARKKTSEHYLFFWCLCLFLTVSLSQYDKNPCYLESSSFSPPWCFLKQVWQALLLQKLENISKFKEFNSLKNKGFMASVGFHVYTQSVISTEMIDYWLLIYSFISVSHTTLIRICVSKILTKCSSRGCNETHWQQIAGPDLLADRKSQ